jgi:hypothetical protein
LKSAEEYFRRAIEQKDNIAEVYEWLGMVDYDK